MNGGDTSTAAWSKEGAAEPGAPEISVVMPARDAVLTIGEQLDALAAQDFDGLWEVIVVDDGSVDGTADFARRWRDKLPSLTVLSSTQSLGQSHAYNFGAKSARGPALAFCDADDVVSQGWLRCLVVALGQNAVVTGPLELSKLNPAKLYSWRGSPLLNLSSPWNGYLMAAVNANLAVRTDVFEALGGFDEGLATGEDYDFAFRVQLAGETIGYAPDAVVHYRLRQGWPYFRRLYDYGLGHVELFRRFRHHGLGRGLGKGALRLAGTTLGLPLFLIPKYRYGWMTLGGIELGRVVGSARRKTLFV